MTNFPPTLRLTSPRWPLRFSVRWLFALTAAIAVWLCFLVPTLHQRSIVAALLENKNFAVHYDYQREVLTTSELTYPQGHYVRVYYPDSFANESPPHPAPGWLRRLVGNEPFQSVTAVSVYWYDDLPAVKSALPDLRRLPALKEIILHTRRIDHPTYIKIVELLQLELPQIQIKTMGKLTIR